MEQKQRDIENKDGKNAGINTALTLLGIALVCALSFIYPAAIILIVFLLPFALCADMQTGKPVVSAGMVVITGVFLYFSPFDYSMYTILTATTGVIVLLNYIIWRYLSIEKFSDGLFYSILFSIAAGIVAALVVFLLSGRQSFSLEIINALKSWLTGSDSEFVNSNIMILYNYDILMAEGSNYSVMELIQGMSGAVDYGSSLTKIQKIEYLMPYIESAVNRYSISSLILYPAFAGIVTWWRGNFRYYKNTEMTKEAKTLKPKPFATFAIPRRFFGVIAIMLIVSFFLQTPGSSDVTINATLVIQDIAYIILAIQGFAVMEYFLKRAAFLKHAVFRIVIIAVVTIFSFSALPVFVGAIDLFINIRFVYAKTKEMKEKIVRSAAMRSEESKKDDETKN